MQDIFDEWTSKYKGSQVLKDGILDERRWQKAERKVLIVLKEDYEHRKEFGSDLRRAFRSWAEDGATKPTLRRLYLIAYAIHFPDRGLPQNNDDWSKAEECFLGSALINLKKVVGNSKSDWSDIDKFTYENADLIERQILEILPDIIVCGGTKDHLRPYL